MKDRDLVVALREVATGASEKRPIVMISNKSQLDTQLKIHGKKMDVNFMWIKSKVEDPLFFFWQLEDQECLADTCYVVFTDPQKARWQDVKEMYDVCQLGDMLVIMVYIRQRKPKVVPSQRGIKVKRGERKEDDS